MSHTPGPWSVNFEDYDLPMIVTEVDDEVFIARMALANGSEAEKRRDADARLIACAPEMLELLKNLIDDEPCRHDHHGYCQTHRLEKNCSVKRAREVIAKAEGK